MTLNASGPLSLGGSTLGQSIALELGRVGTPISFNDADVRALAGIPSGPISLSDFYGKTAGGGGGGGGGVTAGAWVSSATWLNPLNAGDSYSSGTLQFNVNGTIFNVGNSATADNTFHSEGPANWATTPAPGVGNSIWIRLSNVVLTYNGTTQAASSGQNFSHIYSHFGSVPYLGLFINLPFAIGTWGQLSSPALFTTDIENLESDPAWTISSATAGVQGTIEFSTSNTGSPIVATGTFNVRSVVSA